MEILKDLVNKVHIGQTPDWLTNLPNSSIHLTITSPPYYESELYILDDDVLEFGWRTYDDYLAHLESTLIELFRVTVSGGKLILILSNSTETDKEDRNIKFYWPIIHDVGSMARKIGWILKDEAIWAKNNIRTSRYQVNKPPNIQLVPSHDIITIYQKPGNRAEAGDTITENSVWKLSYQGEVKEYNHSYPSFPAELVKKCINLWSLKNDYVLDPYAGSGQVIRYAKEMGRFGIGIEADSKWQYLWEDLNK
ncbi:MAG: site-specific DNA-methyltransferase [Candidatus Heimdallarchaeota archaeon]|nr:site-specific DNA-methyltransferase [Candidatus Heimdallarchaeota archaeon]MDH5645296.1 site-specific DNA-methyltransferase [Candidatus Heimdallarchaeota archaeon]